jgi:methionyl-tRNA formyltransferase
LHDKLAALGGRLMVAELQKLAKAGSLPAVKQPDDGVTYAHKIERAEALIDWNADAAAIERAVRAFNPFPVAFTLYEGEPLKIWAATAQENDGAAGTPGQVLAADDSGITVKCGRGTLTLTDIQRPGGKKMPVSAFLKGHCLKPATVFGS